MMWCSLCGEPPRNISCHCSERVFIDPNHVCACGKQWSFNRFVFDWYITRDDPEADLREGKYWLNSIRKKWVQSFHKVGQNEIALPSWCSDEAKAEFERWQNDTDRVERQNAEFAKKR